MKTNLQKRRASMAQRRELGRAASRSAGAPVPIRHVEPLLVSRNTQHGTRFAPRAQSDFSISAFQRFSLCNDNGFWELTFDGQSAVLKQHPALFYVAWLLTHAPAEPVAA